jgi:hypothetical protein
MTSPQQPDWKRHFQNFRVKIEQPSQQASQPQSPPLNQVEVTPGGFGWELLRQGYQQFIVWFNAIPSSGKLLAIAGGGILGLSLMKTVYQLVNSLISLSFLGVILYLVYRFWISPKNSN